MAKEYKMLEPYTILLVDDTEQNIDILVGLLRDYDLLVALDGESALEVVEEESVDLILMDIMMPEMDGFETCKRLKAMEQGKDIPIIFITAKTDEESIEAAYDVGGLDYVTKPFKPKELLARVRTQLKLKQLIDNLEHLSSRDAMTGIYNRRKFFELGEEIFKECQPAVCGMMLDIDKFKAINDEFGHSVGDLVIKEVTKTIGKRLPESAVFGRLGGEEFAIIWCYDTWFDACELIETLRVSVAQLQVTTLDGDVLSLTISGGLAGYQPSHNCLQDLLKDADKALYQAKGSGRNKSIFRQ